MRVEVLRLSPGADLRSELDRSFRELAAVHDVQAGCIVSAVGSFSQAVLRFAGEPAGITIAGPLELLSLAGTLSLDGPHLHASVSDARGGVAGGHLMPGCIVRTTAEVLVGLLPEWEFRRERDASTGYAELVARRKRSPGDMP